MSLRAKYEAFLASPSSGALAEGAAIHYITTLTSIHEPAPILKHLSVQEKLLKKKEQKVLSAIEGVDAVSMDVETTLEFLIGGGAYLPGLDDNFISDRTATFPMIHIVQFDSAAKITQIRLYWDQASLLKQLDVIGGRARNWPIRDGIDQARLIARSAGPIAQVAAASSRRSTASRGADEVSVEGRPASSRSSTSNAMNDPHASLSLFEARDHNQEPAFQKPFAPRANSARPAPREYSELFAGDGQESPSPTNATPSPVKPRNNAKAGAGKHYKPNRLFEETEEEQPMPTPMSVKTNSKKYNHFEFGSGEDADEATPKATDGRPALKSEHMSQWDFEDFVTPDKPRQKVLGQAVRHFGWSDDEVEDSPVKRPVIHKARPDAESHFEFVDDGTPAGQKKAPAKGRAQNKGMGLYKDHITGGDDDSNESPSHGDSKRPLDDVNKVIKNVNRQKDFGAHWEMTDKSPNPQKAESGNEKHVSEDRQKVVNGMDASWRLYDESPGQAKKENVNSKGIKTSGNGMGGRKDAASQWSIGDAPDDFEPGAGTTSRKMTETKSFWDF